jgi:hypothetical protein
LRIPSGVDVLGPLPEELARGHDLGRARAGRSRVVGMCAYARNHHGKAKK